MDITTFLRLAKKFSDLGDAVGEQLIDAADGADLDKLNPNALRMCRPLLRLLDGYGIEGAAQLSNEIIDVDNVPAIPSRIARGSGRQT